MLVCLHNGADSFCALCPAACRAACYKCATTCKGAQTGLGETLKPKAESGYNTHRTYCRTCSQSTSAHCMFPCMLLLARHHDNGQQVPSPSPQRTVSRVMLLHMTCQSAGSRGLPRSFKLRRVLPSGASSWHLPATRSGSGCRRCGMRNNCPALASSSRSCGQGRS